MTTTASVQQAIANYSGKLFTKQQLQEIYDSRMIHKVSIKSLASQYNCSKGAIQYVLSDVIGVAKRPRRSQCVTMQEAAQLQSASSQYPVVSIGSSIESATDEELFNEIRKRGYVGELRYSKVVNI